MEGELGKTPCRPGYGDGRRRVEVGVWSGESGLWTVSFDVLRADLPAFSADKVESATKQQRNCKSRPDVHGTCNVQHSYLGTLLKAQGMCVCVWHRQTAATLQQSEQTKAAATIKTIAISCKTENTD